MFLIVTLTFGIGFPNYTTDLLTYLGIEEARYERPVNAHPQAGVSPLKTGKSELWRVLGGLGCQ